MAKYKNFHSYKHQFKDTSPKYKRTRVGRLYFTPPRVYLDALQRIIDLLPRLRRMERICNKYVTSLKVSFNKEKEFSISGTLYRIEKVDGYPMLQTKSMHDDDGVFQKLDNNWAVEREYDCIINYIKIFYGEEDVHNIKTFFGDYSDQEMLIGKDLQRRYRYVDSNTNSSSVRTGNLWIVSHTTVSASDTSHYSYK